VAATGSPTKKYGVKSLIHFEAHDTAESAIAREKQIKKWKRAWKLRLIEEYNPGWKSREARDCRGERRSPRATASRPYIRADSWIPAYAGMIPRSAGHGPARRGVG
jgi:hypothetical protein